MLKCNRLFFSSSADLDVFHDRILPDQAQHNYLIECRNKIKGHLEVAIANATVSELGMKKPVKPKFRTQGSWAYDTCVKPAHKEKQEMDWDYGVYLPIDVWESNGPPTPMAKKYFDLVERLLTPLCKENGWHLAQGPERKATCIRIQVASWAHMDIPLYAAPEHEFDKVVEKLALLTNRAMNESISLESMDFADGDFEYNQAWEDMEDIMMATRSGDWRPSDPEAVRRWFEECQRICGNKAQLLRICRYLKAWRDYVYPSGGPSSVAIMVSISKNFIPVHGRDDKALIAAAEILADKVMTDIKEISICDEPFNRLSEPERWDVRLKLINLIASLKQALSKEVYQKQDACTIIINALGNRIPTDVSLIDLDTGAAEIVRNTPANHVPKAVVGVSSSG